MRMIDGSYPLETVHETILRVLVEGVLKDKRCAKSYDCDVFYCGPRIAGECEWFNLRQMLQRTLPGPPSALIG